MLVVPDNLIEDLRTALIKYINLSYRNAFDCISEVVEAAENVVDVAKEPEEYGLKEV